MNQSKVLAAAALTVLMSGSMAAQSYAASKSYCRAVAEDYADHKTGAQQVVPGLVGGAVAGGVIGALIGGKHAVRTGVLVGGATGAVVGAGHANKKWDRYYWRKYEECRRW
ncbi:MAG: hypothetical protein ABI705_14180 [Aestuariivirga sp.]